MALASIAASSAADCAPIAPLSGSSALARASGDAEKGWALFEAIERRFAAQVRFSIPLTGATGLWMTWRLDLWGLFAEPAAWWMDAMVLLWALFMVIVFVVEPLAHRRVAAMAAEDPAALLLRLSRVHRVLLAAGIVTIFGAVAGANGEYSDDDGSRPDKAFRRRVARLEGRAGAELRLPPVLSGRGESGR